MNLTWNNNAYYTGTTAGVHGVCHVGTTYTAVPAGPTTFAGLYTAANFSPAATTPNSNFRAYTSTLTAGRFERQPVARVERSGSVRLEHQPPHQHRPRPDAARIARCVDRSHIPDIDGDVRPGPAGSVNGGATAPDLGADEFDGVPPLANDLQATAFVDPTNGGTKACGRGVLAAGVVHEQRDGDADQRHRPLSDPRCRLVRGLQQHASDRIDPAGRDDDRDVRGHVACRPGSYTIKAKVELAGDQAPANDEITGTLTVEAPLCGNYNVGSGGDFASLTNVGGAFSRLNSVGASCDVTFSIISDLTGETGIGRLATSGRRSARAAIRLLIKPSGVRTITGDSTTASIRALIRLNGADRVTIDGSLTALSGTDRSMTITNADLEHRVGRDLGELGGCGRPECHRQEPGRRR